jgi:hypothetical protein
MAEEKKSFESEKLACMLTGMFIQFNRCHHGDVGACFRNMQMFRYESDPISYLNQAQEKYEIQPPG